MTGIDRTKLQNKTKFRIVSLLNFQVDLNYTSTIPTAVGKAQESISQDSEFESDLSPTHMTCLIPAFWMEGIRSWNLFFQILFLKIPRMYRIHNVDPGCKIDNWTTERNWMNCCHSNKSTVFKVYWWETWWSQLVRTDGIFQFDCLHHCVCI